MQFAYRAMQAHFEENQRIELKQVESEIHDLELKIQATAKAPPTVHGQVHELPACSSCAQAVTKHEGTGGSCYSCATQPGVAARNPKKSPKSRKRRRTPCQPTMTRCWKKHRTADGSFAAENPPQEESSASSVPAELRVRLKQLQQRRQELLNNDVVNRFHLDSLDLQRRHTEFTQIIERSAPDSPERLRAYRGRQKVFAEFRKRFGTFLEPKQESKKLKRRYKSPDVQLQGPPTHCKYCSQSNCVVDNESNATYVCKLCGGTQRYGISPGLKGLPFDETQQLESEPYKYQALGHLKDLLQQVQGHSSHPIPKPLLDQLSNEFQKRGFQQTQINPKNVRYMLKKIERSDYYDDVFTIAQKLNPSYKPIVIKDQHYENLCMIFKEVYAQFPAVVGEVDPHRRNFLSYHGFAKSMCLFLGYNDYVPVFSSLKSSKKRDAQARILERIFDKMEYEFQFTE